MRFSSGQRERSLKKGSSLLARGGAPAGRSLEHPLGASQVGDRQSLNPACYGEGGPKKMLGEEGKVICDASRTDILLVLVVQFTGEGWGLNT